MKLKIWLQILLLSCFGYTSQMLLGCTGTVSNSLGKCFSGTSVNLNLVLTVNSGSSGEYNSGTFEIVSSPSHGTVSGLPYTDTSSVTLRSQTITHQITYTPNSGYEGNDSFTYKVTIISRNNTVTYITNTATVSINVVAERAYVTSSPGGSSAISSIDIATASNILNITGQPNYGLSSNMVISPNGTRAYVCYPNNNKVSVVNAITNAWIQDVSGSFNYPVSIAVSPNGTKAYVSNENADTVSIVNTATYAATNTVLDSYNYISSPGEIVFSPNGTKAYVANGSTSFCIIDALSDAVTQVVRIPVVSAYPSHLKMSLDGSILYVIHETNASNPGNAGTIFLFNTSTNTFLPNPIYDPSYTFNRPVSMAFTPDGLQAYVANYGNSTVSIVNLNPASGNYPSGTYRSVLGLVQDLSSPTFSSPTSIAVDPYGLVAYVANNGNGKVSAINVASNAVTSAITGYTSAQTVCFLSYNPVANSQAVNVRSSSTNNAITLTAADPRNEGLTYAIATQPSHGTLSGLNASTGAVNYTPTAGYTGTDSFTFTATNTSGEISVPAIVSITVDNPIANSLSLSFATSSNSSFTLPGYDPLGQTLTYAVVSGPSHGTLSGLPNTTGVVSYLNNGTTGFDSFVYSVTDPEGIVCATNGTVTMNVSSSPSVAANQTSVTAQQNSSTTITLTGVTTGSALTFAVSTQPSHGTVSNIVPVTPTMATCTYRSTGSYTGQDTFQFTVTNTSSQTSSPATVYVNIVPSSQRAYVVNNNNIVSNVASIDVASQSATGNVTGLSQDSTYLAKNIMVTPDGTKVYLSDISISSSAAFISVINSGNNSYVKNVAGSGSLSGLAGMAMSLNGQKAYVCNAAGASVSILDVATDSITGNVSGSITYPISVAFTPDGSRAYVVSQGTTGFAVNPYVKMINAQTDTFGATVSGLNLNGYQFWDFVLSPDGNFGYLVSNASGGTSRGHVYIIDTNPASPTYNTNVGSIDDSAYNFQGSTVMAIAPNGLKAYVAGEYSTNVSIVDLNPTSATYRKVIGNVSGGSFLNPASIAFTADSTQAYVSNSRGVNGTVSIINTATNAVIATLSGYVYSNGICFLSYAPVGNAQSVSCSINTPYLIQLTASDPRNQSLTYTIASNPSNGFVSTPQTVRPLHGGLITQLTYTPNTGYTGPDSFTFTATNASGQTSAPATVSIMVNDVAPTANSQLVSVVKGSSNNIITLTGTDLAASALDFVQFGTGVSHGTLSGLPQTDVNPFNGISSTGNSVTYTPSSTYTGPDSFAFTVENASSQISSPATISILVENVVALAQAVQFPSNTAGNSIQLSADGGTSPYTFTLITPPSHGILAGLPNTSGTVSYTPTSGYVGSDSFTFKVTDHLGISSENPATVSILVGPLANSSTATVAISSNNNIIVLSGQSVDGQTLGFAVSVTTQQGVSLSNPTVYPNNQASITYTPPFGYSGQDSFDLSVTAGVSTSTARIIINIIDSPTANIPEPTSTTVGVPVTITLTGSDPAGSPLTFNVPSTTANGGVLSFVSSTTTSATYNYLISGYSGVDYFQFSVTNSLGETSPLVAPYIYVADAAPSATGATLNSLSGLSQQITLFATDPGNQPLTFALSGAEPTLGTVTGLPQTSSTGSIVITYTVNPTVTSGIDSFLFTVINPDGLSYTAIVNVTIASIPTGGSSSSVAVTNVMVSKYAGT